MCSPLFLKTMQVLALVAGLGLTEAIDVASFAAASRRCTAICRAAPLRLGLPARPSASPHEEQAIARAALQALCASWPGVMGHSQHVGGAAGAAALPRPTLALSSLPTQPVNHPLTNPAGGTAGIAELDLRGSPLDDGDALRAAGRLPGLELLQLSGCKKLTPALPAALLSRPGSKLRSITLQRCFQLTATALGDVLEAAAWPGSRLTAAALSHLSLADWPEQGAAPPPSGGLRALALHNCSKVEGRALAALAAACPQLEVLMLGGSALVLDELEGASGASNSSGFGEDEKDASSALQLPAAEATHLYQAAQATLLEGPAPVLGIGFAAYVAGVAAQLAALVVRLPRLRVLELTFALPGLAPALQHLAATEVRQCV